MFGLEFSLAAAVNVVAGGLLGATVALGVAWWSTRETMGLITTVARGLEEGVRSGQVEFNYGDDRKSEDIVVHLSGTLRGRSSDSATATVEKESDREADLN